MEVKIVEGKKSKRKVLMVSSLDMDEEEVDKKINYFVELE